jgi:hypothetical protein
MQKKKNLINSGICSENGSNFSSDLFLLVEQHQLAVCEDAVLPLPCCCLSVGWLTTRQTVGGWSFHICMWEEKNKSNKSLSCLVSQYFKCKIPQSQINRDESRQDKLNSMINWKLPPQKLKTHTQNKEKLALQSSEMAETH